jgi:citrate synthase
MLIRINVEMAASALLNASQAAEKLGIRPASLYAYVSRGLLNREIGADRRSLFRREDIDRLSERGRPRRNVDIADVPVQSELTAVADGACFLRGRDVLQLAARYRFEAASEWFWTGSSVSPTPVAPWAPNPAAAPVASLISRLPEALPLDGLRLAAAALAPSDPLRYDLEPEVVMTTGRRLISGLVDSLPGRVVTGTIARRLWSRLGGHADPRTTSLLDQALILLLDHDLSLSTLSARVAASMEADPYAVIAVGLNSLGGPLHSVASLAAEDLLAEISRPAEASGAVNSRLRRGNPLPGFGHRLYPNGDPRAGFLLRRLRGAGGSAARLNVIDSVLDLTRSRELPPPNVDFALAAFAHVFGLVRGASEAIFGVARSSGWIAHALEQYDRGVRLRPRLVYIGAPRPLER